MVQQAARRGRSRKKWYNRKAGWFQAKGFLGFSDASRAAAHGWWHRQRAGHRGGRAMRLAPVNGCQGPGACWNARKGHVGRKREAPGALRTSLFHIRKTRRQGRRCRARAGAHGRRAAPQSLCMQCAITLAALFSRRRRERTRAPRRACSQPCGCGAAVRSHQTAGSDLIRSRQITGSSAAGCPTSCAGRPPGRCRRLKPAPGPQSH